MPAESAVGYKRPVNLTLNADLVAKAKAYTPNLSATVEGLLVEFVQRQQQLHVERTRLANACCTDWNALHAAAGSIADEYGPL